MNTPNNIEQDFGDDRVSLRNKQTELEQDGYRLQHTIGDNEAGKAFVDNEKSRLEGHALAVLTVRGLIYLLAKKNGETVSEAV